MNKKIEYPNLIAPVFTPFKNDKSLNLEVIDDYASDLVEQNIIGVLVNGTTGEGMSLSIAERKSVAKAWVSTHFSNCPRRRIEHVMVQVGGVSLPDVIDLAKHAEEIGANSILCLPDLYIKPENTVELINYLKIVSGAAPNTPLFYYHIPMITNVNIHMGKFLEEIGEQVPTFSGIKFTSNCLDEGVEALKAHHRKFTVFLGCDTLLLGAFSMGFKHAIVTTLNFFPVMAQQIFANYLNNYQDAKLYQDNLSEAVALITKYGKWVPTMKEVMRRYGQSFNCGPTRDLFKDMEESDANILVNELKEILM